HEFLTSLLSLALVQEHRAQTIVSQRVAGTRSHRSLKPFEGLFPFSLRIQNRPEAEECLDEAWGLVQRRSKMLYRQVVFAPLHIFVAQVAVRHRIVLCHCERMLEKAEIGMPEPHLVASSHGASEHDDEAHGANKVAG